MTPLLWIAIGLALLATVLRLAHRLYLRHEAKTAYMQPTSDMPLHGVRIFAETQTLDQLEAVASSVDWTEHRRDKPGTTLLLAPQPYKFEYFVRLIDAIEDRKIRNMSLQLIAPDGRAVDGEGRLMKDENAQKN